jgi:diguanylate cyclase (GGDEF)-like protein
MATMGKLVAVCSAAPSLQQQAPISEATVRHVTQHREQATPSASDRFIGTALALAFLLLTSIIVAVGYLGLRAMERLHADAQNMAATEWGDVQLAIQALDYSNQNSQITLQIVMTTDRRSTQVLLAQQAANNAKISALIKRLQGRVDSEKEHELLQSVIDTRARYVESSQHATDISLQREQPDEARQASIDETAPLLDRNNVAWSDFIRFQADEMNQHLQTSTVMYAAYRRRTAYLIIFAVLLALGITAFEVLKMVAEIHRRTLAENDLQRLNEDLERKVLQRTAALDHSNKDLIAEIAQRRKVEESLVAKTAFLEAQVNSTIDGILVVDRNNRKLLQSQRFIDLFQLPPSVVENADARASLQHVLGKVMEPEQLLQKAEYLYQHPEETSRDEIRLKSGVVLDRYSSPVVGTDGRYHGRIWTFRDISDRKLAEEQARFLAYYDALTQLPNRSLLQDRLEKALAGGRRRNDKVALLFLDLDRFKIINDSLGHSVGDLLLVQVADRLRTWARDQDTVARLGGDEFLIVVNGVKEVDDAAVAAQRIVEIMRGEFFIQGHTLNISCSLGISIFPEHGADAETLTRNADAAMYGAKERGGNSFRFFTEEMNTQVVERLTLENSVRAAFTNRELFLMYQPQVDIASGEIIGVEALLRWRHPEAGLVSPQKLIRVAENSGLIVPLGEWVLLTACTQAQAWQDAGLPAVPIAVNISAVQFRQAGFGASIRRVLQETHLQPQYLELELTEALLLSNEDVIFSVLKDLQDMGLKLAIDDFGTGYSNLNFLKTLPVSKLKIDRSFIQAIAKNTEEAAITNAIISMAKSLNLKVIAEGVETEVQLSYLRKHHCDEIQGYYYSKPVMAEEIAVQFAHRQDLLLV